MISKAVEAFTVVRAWHSSRDSRVALISRFLPENKLYAVQLINRPGHKPVFLTSADVDAQWLEQPRIDVKWINVGSMWIRHIDHKLWNRPVPAHLRCEVYAPITIGGIVKFRVKPKTGAYQHFEASCHAFMQNYTRLWGVEVPPKEIPNEPLPFISKKLPGRPKKPKPEPQSAFDRLLEKDLISE